jgi:8-oxo-dGTP diphosphatase
LTSYAVVAAAIVRDGGVLVARRTHPPSLAGKWELPGGKVEAGESDEAALIRECREELGVTVSVGQRIGPQVTTVDGAGVLRAYLASVDGPGEPRTLDHDALLWQPIERLTDLDLLAADGPLVQALSDWWSGRMSPPAP